MNVSNDFHCEGLQNFLPSYQLAGYPCVDNGTNVLSLSLSNGPKRAQDVHVELKKPREEEEQGGDGHSWGSTPAACCVLPLLPLVPSWGAG